MAAAGAPREGLEGGRRRRWRQRWQRRRRRWRLLAVGVAAAELPADLAGLAPREEALEGGAQAAAEAEAAAGAEEVEEVEEAEEAAVAAVATVAALLRASTLVQ